MVLNLITHFTVAPQKNMDDMIYENRTRRIAPLQTTMALVGAGFCLSVMKNNHHAIFFAPLSFLRRYLVVVLTLRKRLKLNIISAS